MKIRKIIDLCKSNRKLYLYDTETVQWISDGFAVYPLFNLPRMNEDTICAVYDIDEKKRKKIIMDTSRELPGAICFDDWQEGETEIVPLPMTFFTGGMQVTPYMTSQGVAFMDNKYMAPILDADMDMLRIYERQTSSGEIYFAIKSGFLLVGIVMPVRIVTEQFVGNLKELTQKCEMILFNRKTE